MNVSSFGAKQTVCIRSKIMQHKDSLAFCFVVVFLWGMAAHAYGFMRSSLSHDVLNAFVASASEETWKIMLGRYLVPVYRAIFRGPVMLPWLIGLWGLFWSSVAVYLVLQLLELRSKFQTVLVAGIMVTNITYISQIAAYLYEFDFNAFSIVMAILAVYLWRFQANPLGFLLGSVCIIVSIGIYQSFVATSVALIIWISIMDLLLEMPVKTVFQNGIRGAFMVLLGGLLYGLLGKAVHTATGIGLESRTDPMFVEEGQSLISEYIHLILPAIVDLGGNIVHPAYFRYPQIAAILCILALLALLSLGIFRRKKFTWNRLLLLAVLCMALPFGLNCVYFLARGKGMHDLTTYATWFFYIIVLQLAFWVYENRVPCSHWADIAVTAASLLLVFVLWQNVTLSNTAYLKKELDANSTFSTMTRVVSMLEQQEAYDIGTTKIAFVGVPSDHAEQPVFDKIKTITGMDMDSAISIDAASEYYNVYDAYFRYVLNYPVNLCVGQERLEKVAYLPEVQQMPAFPDAGCMEKVNGILVVKIG